MSKNNKKRITNVSKEEIRQFFDAKHIQLENRRKELINIIRGYEQRREELALKEKRGELSAKYKKEAKRVAKKMLITPNMSMCIADIRRTKHLAS